MEDGRDLGRARYYAEVYDFSTLLHSFDLLNNCKSIVYFIGMWFDLLQIVLEFKHEESNSNNKEGYGRSQFNDSGHSIDTDLGVVGIVRYQLRKYPKKGDNLCGAILLFFNPNLSIL